MVVRRVLAEAAIRADEFSALLGERRQARMVPGRRAGETRPERGGGLESDRLREAVVVLLRKRVVQVGGDASAGRVGQTSGERQTRVSRRRVVTEGLEGERHGDQAEGGFLSAHPVGPTVRRVARHPILERRPEELHVTVVTVAQPGADEGVGPGEAGELPDALDVIGSRIT